jgi:adenylylsulfate kinase
MSSNNNIVWHNATVTRERREELNGHKGALIWFTGLSGAGKSTLAHAVEESLHDKGCRTYVLDGDNVRHGLCADLTFSDEDRHENIRRIGHMAHQFVQAGTIVLTAFISPFQSDRNNIRKILGQDFHEIYCKCSIDVCEKRDVKGLYKKARRGIIKEFTGITSPYEEPKNPSLILSTDHNLNESVNKLLEYLEPHIHL